MKLLAIDPGYVNCGWVLFEGFRPTKFGGWFFRSGDSKSFTPFQRSLIVCNGIQIVAKKFGVTHWSTEKYFSQPKISQATNYHRGGLDLLIQIALGHLPGFSINPSTLKKWATGLGNSPKEKVAAETDDWLRSDFPEFYDKLKLGYEVKDQEHILEACIMGDIACWLYRTRISSAAPSKSKLEMLRKLETQDVDISSKWELPANLPRS